MISVHLYYLFCFILSHQVAIKIIDKTQLNPTSLQKVGVSVFVI